MSDHKYTQYGFDGPYWDKKSREIEAELDARTEPGDRAVSWESEPDTEVTWVGENGITWVFVDDFDSPGADKWGER